VDSTELLQIVGMASALILIIPGIILAVRNRQTAPRNIAIIVAVISVVVLLLWLLVRPR